MMGLDVILTIFDNDETGQQGAASIAEITSRAVNIRLPEGVKDISDYVIGGGDLWEWMKPILDKYCPVDQSELVKE